MVNADTRVRFTKDRFAGAMVSLLERQPIGSVTVKALCDEAGLTRGTFYLHYAEPMDVLQEMEWALLERVMGMSSPDGLHDIARQIQIISEEKRLCAAVIAPNGDPAFLKQVCDRLYERLKEMFLLQYPNRDPQDNRRRFIFLFSGATGLVDRWLAEVGSSQAEFVRQLHSFCKSILEAE